jgi:hypothetical protein
MADQTLGVAEWSARERQDLHRRQDADQRAESGVEGGPPDDVAGTGQEPDGGRRRRQAQQPGQGQPPVRGARGARHAPQRLHEAATVGWAPSS